MKTEQEENESMQICLACNDAEKYSLRQENKLLKQENKTAWLFCLAFAGLSIFMVAVVYWTGGTL